MKKQIIFYYKKNNSKQTQEIWNNFKRKNKIYQAWMSMEKSIQP